MDHFVRPRQFPGTASLPSGSFGIGLKAKALKEVVPWKPCFPLNVPRVQKPTGLVHKSETRDPS